MHGWGPTCCIDNDHGLQAHSMQLHMQLGERAATVVVVKALAATVVAVAVKAAVDTSATKVRALEGTTALEQPSSKTQGRTDLRLE